jgi:hypothetical protein
MQGIDPVRRAQVLVGLKTDVENALEELDRGLAPLWEGTTESLRTTITLSGGALVASISVVQLLAGKADEPSAGWLMPLSWVLFGLTIFAAMRAQDGLTQMRLHRLHVIREINQMMADESTDGDETAIRQEMARRTLQLQDIGSGRYKAANLVSQFSFMLAFASMIAFAIINFPF